MSGYHFDQQEAMKDLRRFFRNEKAELTSFGNRVNQTFEAYTFAATIEWYRSHGWSVTMVNPTKDKFQSFKLKFSTRGEPKNYSYALCEKNGNTIQIRHQLRVSTKSYHARNRSRANICCDIAIYNNIDLSTYSTDDALPNVDLISFGEVKHMSAYAELIAGFIGMVHELQPHRLKRIRAKLFSDKDGLAPFLNVSGVLFHTARGVKETINRRKYDIDIYDYENRMIKTDKSNAQ